MFDRNCQCSLNEISFGFWTGALLALLSYRNNQNQKEIDNCQGQELNY